MTHYREGEKRITEFNSTFLQLSEKGKDSALAVLRALHFAQSVTGAEAGGAETEADC